MQYVPPATPGVSPNQFGAGLGGFQDGNPATGTEGTEFVAALWNDILGNLMNVVSVAGIAPTAGRVADLSDSIAAIAAQRQLKAITVNNYQILPGDSGKILVYATAAAALTTLLPDVTAVPIGFNVELRCEGPYPLTVTPFGGPPQTIDLPTVTSMTVRAQRVAFLFGDQTMWRSATRRSGVYLAGRSFITASGNFTVPPGVTELDVDLWGGGGSGNGTPQTGSGGAPGGYAFKHCTVQPGQVLACTIGAGGTGSGPGGSTSFDVLFSATGGGGGTNGGVSGAPGVGVGGDYNGSGPSGGQYLTTGGSGSVPGGGGGSPFGASATPAAGGGAIPGAGGGGGGAGNAPGGAGLIIVRW